MSEIEDVLQAQLEFHFLELSGWGNWKREYRFHPIRQWRFDFAWPDIKLAVEIEGGLYVQGRHARGAGIEKDAEKYAEALLEGWRVLRVSPKHVVSGRALNWINEAIIMLKKENP